MASHPFFIRWVMASSSRLIILSRGMIVCNSTSELIFRVTFSGSWVYPPPSVGFLRVSCRHPALCWHHWAVPPKIPRVSNPQYGLKEFEQIALSNFCAFSHFVGFSAIAQPRAALIVMAFASPIPLNLHNSSIYQRASSFRLSWGLLFCDKVARAFISASRANHDCQQFGIWKHRGTLIQEFFSRGRSSSAQFLIDK